jgi:hypothetical protein
MLGRSVVPTVFFSKLLTLAAFAVLAFGLMVPLLPGWQTAANLRPFGAVVFQLLQNGVGALNYSRGQAGQFGYMHAIAFIRAAGNYFAQKNHVIAFVAYLYGIVLYLRIIISQFN